MTARSVMRFVVTFAMAPLAAACGEHRDPPDSPAAPVPCGTLTCAPTEYCLSEYVGCCLLGCDAGIGATRAFSCQPIPAGCTAGDLCECSEATDLPGGIPVTCEPELRTIGVGCA
ncbi:MAG: hypothetical protein AB7P03_18720 [Kofleriaceae bacterium]